MGNKKQFTDALADVEDLYPNVDVLSRLSTLIKLPDVDLRDLTRLIRTEPTLCLDIIRISNSPRFKSREPCKDIDTAVALIGLEEVQYVVGLIISQQLCGHDLEKYGMSAKDFWAESVTLSCLMEEIAKRLNLDPSEAATIGLLSSIGKVVINNLLEHFKVDVLWDPSIPVAGWEKAMVGFDHASAGSKILARWKFPPTTIQTIEFHLAPENSPESDLMIDLLHYAVKLYHVVGAGCRKADFALPEYPAITTRIAPEDLRKSISRAGQNFVTNTELVFAE